MLKRCFGEIEADRKATKNSAIERPMISRWRSSIRCSTQRLEACHRLSPLMPRLLAFELIRLAHRVLGLAALSAICSGRCGLRVARLDRRRTLGLLARRLPRALAFATGPSRPAHADFWVSGETDVGRDRCGARAALGVGTTAAEALGGACSRRCNRTTGASCLNHRASIGPARCGDGDRHPGLGGGFVHHGLGQFGTATGAAIGRSFDRLRWLALLAGPDLMSSVRIARRSGSIASRYGAETGLRLVQALRSIRFANIVEPPASASAQSR